MSTNCKTEVSLTLEVAKKWDIFSVPNYYIRKTHFHLLIYVMRQIRPVPFVSFFIIFYDFFHST